MARTWQATKERLVVAPVLRPMQSILHFEAVKERLDVLARRDLTDTTVAEQVERMIGSYKNGCHFVQVDGVFRNTVLFQAPYQCDQFVLANILYLDIYYTGNSDFPYMLNVVMLCGPTTSALSVARILLNRQDAVAIGTGMKLVIENVKKIHPNYEAEEQIQMVMEDYADENDVGLAIAFSKKFVEEKVRGRYYHWQRTVYKVKKIACQSPQEKAIFQEVADRVPEVDSVEEARQLFGVVSGHIDISEIEDLNTSVVGVTNEHWSVLKHWGDWWCRLPHLRKLCRGVSDIENTLWDSSPRTNNNCESINRQSGPLKSGKVKALHYLLQHIYCEDRWHAVLILSTKQSATIRYGLPRVHRRRNLKRQHNNQSSPPDTLKQLKSAKAALPFGHSAVGHRVNLLYVIGDEEVWSPGTIISYTRDKGYLITFDNYPPQDNEWIKDLHKGVSRGDTQFI